MELGAVAERISNESFAGEAQVNWSRTSSRVVVVVLLSLASIVVHEFGHYIVYKFARIPVKVSLQSVRPAGPASPQVDRIAKAGGPALSIFAALVCLLLARRGVSFSWITAAFTNASLRLFPCAMDILHAIKGSHPFSDEGDIAVSLATGQLGRILLVTLPFALYFGLTITVGRRFEFAQRRLINVIGIYLLSLAVGIAIVLIDEALHPMKM